MLNLYKFNYATRQGVATGQLWANNRRDVESYIRSLSDYHIQNSEFVWLA